MLATILPRIGRPLAIVGVAAVALACGSSGDSTTGTPTAPTNTGTGTTGNGTTGGGVATTTAFTAVVDGQPWAPTTATFVAQRSNGVLTMAGTSPSGWTLGLTIPIPSGVPGNVPLSTGANAILTSPQGLSWSATWLDGGTATIRVNTYTTSSVSGTFTMTMVPGPGASGGRSVTQGAFNVSFPG